MHTQPFHIGIDDLSGAAIIAFLEAHAAELRSLTPPESTHVLDLEGLRSPEVRFWAATDDDGEIVGCAALKTLDAVLDPGHAELKSMRTAAHRTRQGIASRLVEHVLAEARAAGFTRISLETGADAFFAPARALYERHGFTYCGPFDDYRHDPLSAFLTLRL